MYVLILLSDGDPRNEFYLGRENGNLLLAKRLLWERQSEYALNVSATDGVRTRYVAVRVTVVNDALEDGVRFSRDLYEVAVDEDAPPDRLLLTLRAEGGPRLRYGLLAARRKHDERLFRLDEESGELRLAAPLDRERAARHELTVWARAAAPRAARAAARVVITVRDVDDHAPEWGRRLAAARVSRDALPGTLVARLRAADRDAGENARIVYSLADAGGGPFAVHAALGDVTLAGPLPPSSPPEYALVVRAANPGPPSAARSASLPLHVSLTAAADPAPPVFVHSEITAAVAEGDASYKSSLL